MSQEIEVGTDLVVKEIPSNNGVADNAEIIFAQALSVLKSMTRQQARLTIRHEQLENSYKECQEQCSVLVFENVELKSKVEYYKNRWSKLSDDYGKLSDENMRLREENRSQSEQYRQSVTENERLRNENVGLQSKNAKLEDENVGLQSKNAKLEDENVGLKRKM